MVFKWGWSTGMGDWHPCLDTCLALKCHVGCQVPTRPMCSAVIGKGHPLDHGGHAAVFRSRFVLGLGPSPSPTRPVSMPVMCHIPTSQCLSRPSCNQAAPLEPLGANTPCWWQIFNEPGSSGIIDGCSMVDIVGATLHST